MNISSFYTYANSFLPTNYSATLENLGAAIGNMTQYIPTNSTEAIDSLLNLIPENATEKLSNIANTAFTQSKESAQQQLNSFSLSTATSLIKNQFNFSLPNSSSMATEFLTKTFENVTLSNTISYCGKQIYSTMASNNTNIVPYAMQQLNHTLNDLSPLIQRTEHPLLSPLKTITAAITVTALSVFTAKSIYSYFSTPAAIPTATPETEEKPSLASTIWNTVYNPATAPFVGALVGGALTNFFSQDTSSIITNAAVGGLIHTGIATTTHTVSNFLGDLKASKAAIKTASYASVLIPTIFWASTAIGSNNILGHLTQQPLSQRQIVTVTALAASTFMTLKVYNIAKSTLSDVLKTGIILTEVGCLLAEGALLHTTAQAAKTTPYLHLAAVLLSSAYLLKAGNDYFHPETYTTTITANPAVAPLAPVTATVVALGTPADTTTPIAVTTATT